jgi:putative transcriptional regulator
MIAHHPSADVLQAFASGAMRASATLVTGCHVEVCETCRREVAVWSDVGGALLEASSPESLSATALDDVLARLDESPAATPERAALPRYLERFNVPRGLRKQEIGSRLWLAPGIWFAPLRVKSDPGALTYLVYADRNTTLPQHTHTGEEFTAILSGSYRDALGTFAAGDFAEADKSILHAPSVTQDAECLCLITSDGPMALQSLSARVIQTLAGRRY